MSREVADLRVAEALDAADVDADVVPGPVLAELLAARRRLTDEVAEVAVVGIASGGRAQDGDHVARDAVPVEVEVAGARVEEDEPRGVRALLAVEHLEEERAAEGVGAEDVQAVVADVGGGARHRLERLLHGRSDAVAGRIGASVTVMGPTDSTPGIIDTIGDAMVADGAQTA